MMESLAKDDFIDNILSNPSHIRRGKTFSPKTDYHVIYPEPHHVQSKDLKPLRLPLRMITEDIDIQEP